MTQYYSCKERENDKYALPDVEVFYISETDEHLDEEGDQYPSGYYWWSCFPGCLPDSTPMGPFASEE